MRQENASSGSEHNQRGGVKRSNLGKVLQRSFGLLMVHGTWLTPVTVALNITLGLVPPAIGLTAKALIDGLIVPKPNEVALLYLVGLQAVLIVLGSIFMQVTMYAYTVLGERVQLGLRLLVLEHASRLELAFFEQPENQDILSKAQRELGFRPVLIVQFILSGLQALVTVLGFFAVVATVQPWLMAVLFVGLVPAVLVSRKSAHLTMNFYGAQTPRSRLANYLESILTDAFYAKEVRLNGLVEWLLPRTKQLYGEHSTERIAIEGKKAFNTAVGDVFSGILHYASIALIVVETARGALTIGEFTLLLTALSSVRVNLLQIVNQMGNLLESALLFSDLDTFLSVPTTQRLTGTRMSIDAGAVLRLENISFSYPGSDRSIFENFSLVLRHDETVAIVGNNGAGKTTLVKLLTRLYEPSSGTIWFNDVDVRKIDLNLYRTRFAVILQDFIRYQFTAEENVALALPVDETNLERVAKLARINAIIEILPNKWRTHLGRSFDERGQDLSGGQWQRIALARALYRDAPILILDEPTSALDPESEAELFKSYKDLARGKICLLITHRLANASIADRIVVIEHGQIIEDGTHDQLMKRQGRYHAMYSAQASAFYPTNP